MRITFNELIVPRALTKPQLDKIAKAIGGMRVIIVKVYCNCQIVKFSCDLSGSSTV